MGFGKKRTPLEEGDSVWGPRNRKGKVLEDEYDWHGQLVVKVKWLDTNTEEIVPVTMVQGTRIF